MAQYSKAALTAAVLLSLNSVSAWTSSSNIALRPILAPSSSQLKASPFSSIETDLLNKLTADGSAASSSPSIINQLIQTEQATEKAINNVEKSSANSLLDIFNSIDDLFASFTSQLNENVVNSIPKDDLSNIITQGIDVAKENAQSIDDLLVSNPSFGPVVTFIQNKLTTSILPFIGDELANLPPSVAILASATITYTIVSTALSMNQSAPQSTPYPLGRYDPITARAYFDNRLSEVIGRGVEIGSQSFIFGLALLSDKLK